jgi:hypothetical protein
VSGQVGVYLVLVWVCSIAATTMLFFSCQVLCSWLLLLLLSADQAIAIVRTSNTISPFQWELAIVLFSYSPSYQLTAIDARDSHQRLRRSSASLSHCFSSLGSSFLEALQANRYLDHPSTTLTSIQLILFNWEESSHIGIDHPPELD